MMPENNSGDPDFKPYPELLSFGMDIAEICWQAKNSGITSWRNIL
jgi:hypothetical protein